MPRYLVVPEPLDVRLPDGTTKSVAFADYVLESLGAEPKLVPTYKAVRQLDALLNKLADAAPGTVVDLDEDFWERCKQAIEEPTGAYNFRFARQVTPFLEALLKATGERKAAEKRGAAPTKSNGTAAAAAPPAKG